MTLYKGHDDASVVTHHQHDPSQTMDLLFDHLKVLQSKCPISTSDLQNIPAIEKREVKTIIELYRDYGNISDIDVLSEEDHSRITGALKSFFGRRKIKGSDDIERMIHDYEYVGDSTLYQKYHTYTYGVAASFLARNLEEYRQKSPENANINMFSKDKITVNCTHQFSPSMVTLHLRNTIERLYLYLSFFMCFLAMTPHERIRDINVLNERINHHKGPFVLSFDCDGEKSWHDGMTEDEILSHWKRVFSEIDTLVKNHFGESASAIYAKRCNYKWHIYYPNIYVDRTDGKALVQKINAKLKKDLFFGTFSKMPVDEALFGGSGLRMLGAHKGRMGGPRGKGDESVLSYYVPVDSETFNQIPMTLSTFVSCTLLAPEGLPRTPQIKPIKQYHTEELHEIADVLDTAHVTKVQQEADREALELGEKMRKERMNILYSSADPKDGILIDTEDSKVYTEVEPLIELLRSHDEKIRDNTLRYYSNPPRFVIQSRSKEHSDKKKKKQHQSNHVYWSVTSYGLEQRCMDPECGEYRFLKQTLDDFDDTVKEFLAKKNVYNKPMGFVGDAGILVVQFALKRLWELLMIDPEELDKATFEWADDGFSLILPTTEQTLVFTLPGLYKELTDTRPSKGFVFWKNRAEIPYELKPAEQGALCLIARKRQIFSSEKLRLNYQRAKDKLINSSVLSDLSLSTSSIAIPEHRMFFDDILNNISRDLCTGSKSALVDLLYYVGFSEFSFENGQWYCLKDGIWRSGDEALGYLIELKNNHLVSGLLSATVWYYKEMVEIPEAQRKTILKKLQTTIDVLRDLTDYTSVYRNIRQCFNAGGNIYRTSFKSEELFSRTLDQTRELISFENGVWNRIDDSFGPATAEMRISIQAPCKYPEFTTPSLLAQRTMVYNALRPMMPSDEMFDYLMMTLSTMFRGENVPATFYMWVGRGSNGKSVLQNLLQSTFGGYVKDSDPTMFTRPSNGPESASPGLMTLKSKRLLIMAEPEGKNLQTNLIKRFTGGTEIQARGLFQNEITTFIPMAQSILQCNELPMIDKFDGGTARRVQVVPFQYVFKTADEYDPTNKTHRLGDTEIQQKLIQNKDGFAMLLVEYFKMLRDKYNGIVPVPDEVRTATERWLCANDIVYDFKVRFCRHQAGAKEIKVPEMYRMIKDYYTQQYGGNHPTLKVPSQVQLGERLWSCGFSLEKRQNKNPVMQDVVVNTVIEGFEGEVDDKTKGKFVIEKDDFEHQNSASA